MSHVQKDKTQFPFIYRMVPKQEPHYLGVVKLLLHFRWTWIGLLAPENDHGERFMSTFRTVAIQNDLCVAFTESIPVLKWTRVGLEEIVLELQKQVNVVIYHMDPQTMLMLALVVMYSEVIKRIPLGKVWVATVLQDQHLRFFYNTVDVQYIHGSLSFIIQAPKKTEHDNLDMLSFAIEQFGERVFDCSYVKPALSVKGWVRCTEKEKWEPLAQDVVGRILSQDSNSIYNSVLAVAWALHAASASRLSWRATAGAGNQMAQPWQVFLFPLR